MPSALASGGFLIYDPFQAICWPSGYCSWPIMDYKAATRINGAITGLTNSKASSLNEEKLKELKALLRTSDELVSYAHSILMDRLAANHSQSRRLALQLCDVLFSRSKCFRRLLTAHFSLFVELTVGHKPEKPLPPPPSAAIELRQNALECIEKWREQWGLQYPQVTLAYKYLKKHYKFPEIASRAAAAAAAAAARQHRHQQMLQQRYEVFMQEFPQQQQQMQSLLHQMQECFELLRQPMPSLAQPEGMPLHGLATGSDQQAHAPGTDDTNSSFPHLEGSSQSQGQGLSPSGIVAPAAPASGEGVLQQEQEWEDVVTAPQPAAAEAAGGAAGSAADESGADDYDADELVGDFQADLITDPAAAAGQATVSDQLSDLVKQAQLATSRTLLDWLRLLTQIQVQEQQRQQRQQHLRAVVDLRAQLQAALQEASNWTSVHDSTADKQQNQNRPQAAGSAEAAGQMTAGSGSRLDTDSAAAVELEQLPTRSLQPLQLSPHRASGTSAGDNRTGRISFASNLNRQAEQQQETPDVYANIQDPTAAATGIYIIPKEVRQLAEEGRWVLQQHSDSDSEQHATAAAAAAAGNAHDAGQQQSLALATTGPHSKARQEASGAAVSASASAGGISKPAKGIDPAVRQKLAAAAPKLPIAGDDWMLAQHGVSSHGMELYNHWGAVDSTTSIPQDRLREIVGYTASYYKPSKKKRKVADVVAGANVTAANASAADGGAAAGAVRPLNCGRSQSEAPAQNLPAGVRTGASTAPMQHHNTQHTAAAAHPIEISSAANDPAASGTAAEARTSRTPTRRESASAHNRAVLAGVSTDEEVAAAVQQQLNAEAAKPKGRKGRAAKPPETKADKLRKKLLGLK